MSILDLGRGLLLVAMCLLPADDPAQPDVADQQGAAINRQDVDQRGETARKTIHYRNLDSVSFGSRRSSKHWVQTGQGVLVAVDDGLQYDGTNLYLSLTGDLVAVDQKTRTTKWSTGTGGHWNQMAIQSVEPTDDQSKPRIVVALKSAGGDDAVASVVRYDFKTGSRLEEDVALPEGKFIEPIAQFMGDDCGCDEPIAKLITDRQAWLELRKKYFGSVANELPRDDLFDDGKQVVLVLSEGSTTNCRGVKAQEILQGEAGMVVRLQKQTYQSLGDTPTVRPYGIIVLPRADGNQYVIEENQQSFKGGPPVWKATHDFQLDGR